MRSEVYEPVRIHAELLLDGGGEGFPMRFVRAGQTLPLRGFGKGVVFPEAVLRAAVAEGFFDGRAVFFRHVDGNRDPRDLAGVTANARFDEETGSVVGEVFAYQNQSGNELSALVGDFRRHRERGIPHPNIGISIDAFFQFSREGRVPVAQRLVDVNSVDVVFNPAADGRILASHSGGTEMPEDVVVEDVADGKGKEPVRAQAENGEQWLASMRTQAVAARLQTSGLPAVVVRRLAAGMYQNPEDLETAIQAARDELAELSMNQIVNVGPLPPRGSGITEMRNGVEQVRAAVDWLFGAPDAALPDPFLRDVRRLYHVITGDFEFRGTYHPDRVYLTGADTATLPDMAANAMNKVVINQFSLLTHYRWYERVSFPTPNDGSVHDMQWTTVGGIGDLPSVPEKGAYDELSLGDVKETDAFTKFGGYLPITLEMIRNSDIQRLQSVPRALALAAVRTRSAKCAAIFTANAGVGPTLDQDSKALFHADHNNLATTALGTDATAWRAARAECFNQTEVNSGKALGLFPRYWLGPADLYDQALSVFGYGEGMPTSFAPEAQDRGFADPRPIPLAVPEFTDANDWAYIVDPLIFPVIHISYAQAPGGGQHPAPELFTVTSPTAGLVFTNDVLPVKVRDWFAIGVNGFRGIGKRNVA